MAKITILKEEKIPHNNRYRAGGWRRWSGWFLVLILVLGFVGGMIGTLGGMVILSSTTIGEQIRSKLGIKEIKPLIINRTRTDKIVVEESSAITDAVEKIKSAVVSVTGEGSTGLFGITLPPTAGSGFIITSDGLIATNKHVVSDEGAKYTVFTADGKKYSAQVLARDPYNDLAVLKIEAKSLPVVGLGDSDKLKIGQWVIAIGNALGEFDNSVTVGVVSAKNRQVTPTDPSTGLSEQLDGLIQTDAPIFSGNSGGPLVNLDGQVVGINTAKGPEQGLAFAIPINSLKVAIQSVEQTHKIIRPMIGVRYIPITNEIATNKNLPVDYGVLIYAPTGEQAVVPGSPAAKAGLQIGDIITEINGERIDSDHSLKSLIEKYKPGDEVTLKIISGKKEKTVKIKLSELK